MESWIAFMKDFKSLWWSICPSIPLFVGQVVEIFAKSDLNPITAPAHQYAFVAVE